MAGYGELFWTFAKVGIMTFGGGYAMLPILQREIVENKHWATDEELTDYFAIGQCTPGIIAVNTATFIGSKNRGIPGGILATLGLVFPSLVIITLLAALISSFFDLIIVQKAFAGVRVCVGVLIFNAICKLWKSSIKDHFTLILFLLVTTLALFTTTSPTLFIIGAALIGVILEILPKKANKEDQA